MADIRQRLRAIEQDRPPDLWATIVDRSTTPEVAPIVVLPTRTSRRVLARRIIAAVIAAAIAIAALSYLKSTFRSVPMKTPKPPLPHVTGGSWGSGGIVYGTSGGTSGVFSLQPGRSAKGLTDFKPGIQLFDEAWSPDGTKILFSKVEYPHSTIYVMNADGSGIKDLGSGWSPVWSPDGSMIAFVTKPEGLAPLEVMDADGTHVRQIAQAAASEGRPLSWAPDGSRIAFEAFYPADRSTGIGIAEVDGSAVTRLTPADEFAWGPKWSPDGRSIAYVVGRPTHTFHIAVRPPDGSTETILGEGTNPTWSPDGTKLAFTREVVQRGALQNDVFVMNADGSAQTDLTKTKEDEDLMGWSPDGTMIAFTSSLGPNADLELSVVHVDGSGMQQLTNDPVDVTF